MPNHPLAACGGMGQGVPQDYKEALHWSRLAAEQGDRGPASILDTCTPGTTRSYRMTERHCAGIAWPPSKTREAPFTLGFMLRHRAGRAADTRGAPVVIAGRTTRNSSFQFDLAEMLRHGQGVSQDHIQAHMWWELAAAQGDKESSDEHDRVAGNMTQSQIEQAQRLAREWKRKK